MLRFSVLQASLLLLAVLTAGCGGETGPKLAETAGVVTYKGKPLADANVTFMPASGPAAYGSTDANGAYELSTTGDKGAMVGPARVVITAFEMLDEEKPEEKLTAADLKKMNTPRIPPKFGNPETSGLTADIKPDVRNEFNFDL